MSLLLLYAGSFSAAPLLELPAAAPVWDTGQGMAGYVSRLNRQHTSRLAADDRAATEFIMALVFSEILYGTVQH